MSYLYGIIKTTQIMEEQQVLSIEEQIQIYLAEHLKINIRVDGGDYGSSKHIEVEVTLNGELITSSSDTF